MQLIWNVLQYVMGVNEGGVILPVLFCIYIDGLVIGIEKSGVVCYIEECVC